MQMHLITRSVDSVTSVVSRQHAKIQEMTGLLFFLIYGKPVCTNIDEFLEKFQTAFDPPPPPLFWEKCCDFFLRNFLERK